jgi:hypothetical protein
MNRSPCWEGSLSFTDGFLTTSIGWRCGLSPQSESEWRWKGSLGTKVFRLTFQAVRTGNRWEAELGWVARMTAPVDGRHKPSSSFAVRK